MQVTRYGKGWPPSGDFMSIDGVEFETRRLVEMEKRRAAWLRPDWPSQAMRPMFKTGSAYGAELAGLLLSEDC